MKDVYEYHKLYREIEQDVPDRILFTRKFESSIVSGEWVAYTGHSVKYTPSFKYRCNFILGTKEDVFSGEIFVDDIPHAARETEATVMEYMGKCIREQLSKIVTQELQKQLRYSDSISKATKAFLDQVTTWGDNGTFIN
jgi:hypothetical protein